MDFKIKNNVLTDYIGTKARVVIPDSVTNIGHAAFWNRISLTDIKIPNTVTNIGAYAFASCESLKSVVIPDKVTTIGEDTFSCCTSLSSATISDNVTFINDTAFDYCPNLTIKCNPGSYAESWAKDHGFKTAPLMSKMRLALYETAANIPAAPDCDSVVR